MTKLLMALVGKLRVGAWRLATALVYGASGAKLRVRGAFKILSHLPNHPFAALLGIQEAPIIDCCMRVFKTVETEVK